MVTMNVGSAALAVSGSSWLRIDADRLSVKPLVAEEISDAQPLREHATTPMSSAFFI
jgi:hypothetical protein